MPSSEWGPDQVSGGTFRLSALSFLVVLINDLAKATDACGSDLQSTGSWEEQLMCRMRELGLAAPSRLGPQANSDMMKLSTDTCGPYLASVAWRADSGWRRERGWGWG